MENIEKRLELIKMLRNEHEANVGRIQKRENILYPNRKPSYSDSFETRPYHYSGPIKGHEDADRASQSSGGYGFYMRLGICMGLFLGFVYMETQNITFWGISHEQIQQVICETIDVNSFAFMEQFPYTLEGK